MESFKSTETNFKVPYSQALAIARAAGEVEDQKLKVSSVHSCGYVTHVCDRHLTIRLPPIKRQVPVTIEGQDTTGEPGRCSS